MASVGSAWFQCHWLYQKLKQDNIIQGPLMKSSYVIKMLLSLTVMAVAIWLLGLWQVQWYEIRWFERFYHLFAVIILSAMAYLLSMWLLNAKKDFT